MNPIEFHPFEMQFEVPDSAESIVYTRRFQAPRRLKSPCIHSLTGSTRYFKLHFKWMKFYRIHGKFLFFRDNL